MRICFLSSAHPPDEIRPFQKEAVSLVGAGFDVVHLAPGEMGETCKHGVEIITYRSSRSIPGRVLKMSRLFGLARRLDVDCYHCNELDSWVVGAALKLTRRTRLVADVHEHYPATLAESRFPPWLRPTVENAVRLVYRLLVPVTDRIVLAKQSVASDFRGSEAKHVLVRNYTLIPEQTEPSGRDDVDGGGDGEGSEVVTAIHIGVVSRKRGWPQLVEALAQVQSKHVCAHIVGTFNDGSQEAFEQRVAELGLEDRVGVEGWMPFEEVCKRVRAASIGLVLFQPGLTNNVYALPHKMFEYMMAGIPVIAPDFAEEVAAIITEADCGILVDPSNPAEIAEALDRLASDATERKRMGENGRRAVAERYNWDAEAETLIAMYRELAEGIV